LLLLISLSLSRICGSTSRSTNVKTEIKKEIFQSLKAKNTIEESKEKKIKITCNSSGPNSSNSSHTTP
jgi:uncharacterized protein YjhX (UPF0386 family)